MATVEELSQLTPEELTARAQELKRQIFDHKSKHSTGVLDSTADLGKARKDVARCYTLRRQKQLEAARAAKAGAAGNKE